MDFGKVDLVAASDKGAECHLNDPVYGNPLYLEGKGKVAMTIAGRDGALFKQAQADANAVAEANPNADPEAVENAAIRMMVTCIMSWQNIIWDGEPMEFTPDNAFKLLKKFPPVRLQVDAFISKRSNFFKDAKKK